MEIDGLEGEESRQEAACNTLLACIVTTVNYGLRSGGGIGDVLRQTSQTEALHGWRVLYDMTFFFLMIVINMNLILGIIIDTFADLRKDKQDKDDLRKFSCFICGLQRQVFDSKGLSSFEKHCREEHHLWSYLNFVILLKTKDQTEFTGQESYVFGLLSEKPPNLTWFPRLMAMSLKEEKDGEDTDILLELTQQLARATDATQELSSRLVQLQQNMAVQRKEATRAGMQVRQGQPGESSTASLRDASLMNNIASNANGMGSIVYTRASPEALTPPPGDSSTAVINGVASTGHSPGTSAIIKEDTALPPMAMLLAGRHGGSV